MTFKHRSQGGIGVGQVRGLTHCVCSLCFEELELCVKERNNVLRHPEVGKVLEDLRTLRKASWSSLRGTAEGEESARGKIIRPCK